MNTRINYLYRDGSNYKQHNEAVLVGEFQKKDLNTIKNILDGEFFVPEQVGLHLTRPDDNYTEDDHCLAELFPDEDIELTDAEPFNADEPIITWEQFIKNFKEVKKTGWNPVAYEPTPWNDDEEVFRVIFSNKEAQESAKKILDDNEISYDEDSDASMIIDQDGIDKLIETDLEFDFDDDFSEVG